MTAEDRRDIERKLRLGKSVAEIARDIGRPESTVAREVKNRRIDSAKGMSAKNSLCALFDSCRRTCVCAVPCGMRKLCRNCHRCFEACAEFVRRACPRLASSPFVCNGCEKIRTCPLKKKFYLAEGAQDNYGGILRESRRGIQTGDAALRRMDGVFSACAARKQSIRNIMANNPGAFPVCERTVYTYTASKLFAAGRGDLPFACARKPRKRKAVTKTCARCRAGRTYKDFVAYTQANADAPVTEMDTVEGAAGGSVIFTFSFTRERLMVGFASREKDAASCARVIGKLWRAAGPALFRKLFAVVLTDNGPEFSDPASVEADPTPGACEPRARMFYCDAYCASQKPHVERTHGDMRRILPKGVPLDSLSQEDVSLVFSHVDSYTRGVIDNRTPFDLFVENHGEAGRLFLERLGIVRVPDNEVTLMPEILGAAFANLAHRVFLRQNGIG